MSKPANATRRHKAAIIFVMPETYATPIRASVTSSPASAAEDGGADNDDQAYCDHSIWLIAMTLSPKSSQRR